MKQIVVLFLTICFLASTSYVFALQDRDTTKDELYVYSVKKTFFQNLGDWFSMWGRGVFNQSNASGRDKTNKQNPEKQK